ncbi:MAG: potassium transporter KtrB [Planctomycetes bacterium]|nr:potassium transporter KtrB [Planctomycetota bacterium]
MQFLHDLWVRLRALGRRFSPPQFLLLGFGSYALLGTLLLALPFAQTGSIGWIDNLFVAVSAMSTTGLSTVSTGDDYTWFGQAAILVLFQLGGIGYMTLSSFVILARKQKLGQGRESVLKAQFALPQDFQIRLFVRQVVLFTLIVETLGAVALLIEFQAAGEEAPVWSALFHSISAFCTAGFSLHNNSLEAYRANPVVNATIAGLCYAGGIGFIVLQDAWLCLRVRGRKLTFTSRVILAMTLAVLLLGTPLLFFLDPWIASLPPGEGLMAAAFQVMTASSTAGFNTVPIGQLGAASLLLLSMVMVIGASPSGTGGGVKTTSVSALVAVVLGTLRGTGRVTLGRNEIPTPRVHTAVTNVTLYLTTLFLGLFALGLARHEITLSLAFEAASALGTVGLSMGETGNLNSAGKLIVTVLMFLGRVGPLTAGLAFLGRRAQGTAPEPTQPGDLTV